MRVDLVGPNDPEAARAYHERTKHSPASVRTDRHRLDWEIQPLPFKIYRDLDPIPLPRDLGRIDVPALDALAHTEWTTCERVVPGVTTLARLLHFSAGVTRERTFADGRRFHFRAAPCTGALYHIDLYLVCGDLDGLEAGVYHFGPHDFSLRRLRAGDHRRVLHEATGAEPSVTGAPVVLVAASTFWRNAWKYQARAYRHCYWDAGTMLAHVLALAAAERLPARIVMGFADGQVNALLGLEARREAALALVGLGHDPTASPPPAPELERLALQTLPLSSREVEYSAIREMHEASSLADAASAAAWRGAWANAHDDGAHERTSDEGDAPPLALRAAAEPRARALDRTIAKRGSARSFTHEPISFETFSTLVASTVSAVPFDFRSAGEPPLDEPYVIVNAMDGLPPGRYALTRIGPARDGLGLLPLGSGIHRREAGFLGLGQELPADAAADVYYLASLDRVFDRLGARGYRAAQLEAAIHGGRMYLAAYAMGLSATGLTFFDDDVTSFFSPHAAGKAVMFLVAVGHGRKRAIGAR